ncbi:MAG: queuosine precursor transporter [Myxococcales bacterium]|nr:queuosine precursor transporter [Myxococcales bacterium]
MSAEPMPLPSEQHRYEGLEVLDPREVHRRREGVFLVLSGLFLGTLAILNILGITRFIDLGFEVLGQRVMIAVGVLPYPVTFLCTDLISEIYGQRRANAVVWMGLALNLWLVFILWLGGILPAAAEDDVFMQVRTLTFAAVTASMVAYLTAQFVDVWLFHFWKRLTRGRHLWLRNNASTLASQLVDTVAVILVTHFLAHGLPIDDERALWPQLLGFIVAGYVFKAAVALADTLPFYLGVRGLARYLRLPPAAETVRDPSAVVT